MRKSASSTGKPPTSSPAPQPPSASPAPNRHSSRDWASGRDCGASKITPTWCNTRCTPPNSSSSTLEPASFSGKKSALIRVNMWLWGVEFGSEVDEECGGLIGDRDFSCVRDAFGGQFTRAGVAGHSPGEFLAQFARSAHRARWLAGVLPDPQDSVTDDAHRFLVERAELIESEMRGIRLRGERTGNRVLVVMFCIEAHAIESRPTGSARTAKRAASIADGRGGGGDQRSRLVRGARGRYWRPT